MGRGGRGKGCGWGQWERRLPGEEGEGGEPGPPNTALSPEQTWKGYCYNGGTGRQEVSRVSVAAPCSELSNRPFPIRMNTCGKGVVERNGPPCQRAGVQRMRRKWEDVGTTGLIPSCPQGPPPQAGVFGAGSP